MTPEGLRLAAEAMHGETPEERWAAFVESKLVEQGEPPFAAPWWDLMRDFWRSGKFVLAVGGANRAGKTSHINGMCAIPEMLFRERATYADSDLVWPNCSATIELANLSLRAAAFAARAVGFEEVKGRSKDLPKRLEFGTVFVSEGNRSAPGTIEFIDTWGNRVEYRAQAATAMGLSGYTGLGATADELELKGWGSPQETRDSIGLMKSRLKGQAGTHVYMISRLFADDGVLSTICARGDNEGLMVARLGARGAEYDERARRHLKAYLAGRGEQGDREARRYAQDRRLTEEADPDSYVLPGWSLLPIGDAREPGPEAAIMSCWRRACDGTDLDEGEVPLDGLLRVYGGRPTGREGERYIYQSALDVARVQICVPAGYTGRRGAGFDPAVTLNACTLAIVRERRDELWEPQLIRAWQGSSDEPLDIRLNVGPEAAEIVRSAGLTSWRSDLFARADVRLVSRDAGLSAEFDEESVIDSYNTARVLIHRWLREQTGARLLLRSDDPDLDEACALVARELAQVLLRRRQGKAELVIPTVGGQHGDRARALVRALRHARAGSDAPTFDARDLEAANAQFRSGRVPIVEARDLERFEDVFRSHRAR